MVKTVGLECDAAMVQAHLPGRARDGTVAKRSSRLSHAHAAGALVSTVALLRTVARDLLGLTPQARADGWSEAVWMICHNHAVYDDVAADVGRPAAQSQPVPDRASVSSWLAGLLCTPHRQEES